jgi:hypothetical protein
MKTTIKINGTAYTLSSGRATYENKHLTEEQRLQLRVNAVTLLANKKHRKPTLKKCPRVYPKFGAIQSTAQYVADYYTMNLSNYGKQAAQDEAAQIIAGLFQPLSTRISVPTGEDTQEQDA